MEKRGQTTFKKRGQTTFILRMAKNGGRLRFSVSHFSDLKKCEIDREIVFSRID
jgi:predicted ester cyclase